MVEHEENVRREEEEEEEEAAKQKKNQESNSSFKKWNLKKSLSDKEILAQATFFLAAGYETSASTLGFIAYTLANYPECQEKLCHEIEQVLSNHVCVYLCNLYSILSSK